MAQPMRSRYDARMRKLIVLLAGLALSFAGLVGWCYREATSDPVVRRAEVAMPGLDRPVRIALLSDIHIGTVAMGPARLGRIVGQVNALEPDLVVIAGDFIFGHDPQGAAKLGPPMVGPLRQLRAPLGVAAVLGNHDYWTGPQAVRDQLQRAGVTVLENQAALRGPIALGGVSDDFSHHADAPATLPRRLHQGVTDEPSSAPAGAPALRGRAGRPWLAEPRGSQGSRVRQRPCETQSRAPSRTRHERQLCQRA